MTDNSTVLMGAYVGLVRALAYKIHQKLPRHVDLEDLVGYGCVGLAEAARSFDDSRGVKFSTFAHLRIRGAIMDGLQKMSWFRHDQFDRNEYRDSPTDDAVGETAPVHADEFSDNDASADEQVAEMELHLRLRQLIQGLPTPAAELLHATYYEGMSLQDAAKRMGYSKSWASRLHAQTVNRLAKSLKSHVFK